MIALKKLCGDELLRLALVLSLLKANPTDLLERETQHLTAGLHISNGSDWSIENEARTLIRPSYVHPKSLDNILLNYETEIFEELNSLGRYGRNYAYRFENNDRTSNANRGPVVHTYVLNNLATDTAAPALAESPASLADDDGLEPHYGVSDDGNVGQEVKVSDEESQTSETPDVVVTLSQDFFSNRSESDVFAEIASRSFDVSEFLVPPERMYIKTESLESESNDEDVKNIKKEVENDDLYSDNAMDDFVPYFVAKSEKFDRLESDSVFEQNMADLQDYSEIFDDVKDLKKDLEYLDVKQQQDNLEQYLLENTPLDTEAYELAPMFEEELVLDVKKERASTSFTSSASSSGVSEMDVGAEEVAFDVTDVKSESDEGHHSGDELTQEVSCFNYYYYYIKTFVKHNLSLVVSLSKTKFYWRTYNVFRMASRGPGKGGKYYTVYFS